MNDNVINKKRALIFWCRVVAVDMRGYGDSDKPPGVESYKLKSLTEDVEDLVEGLGRLFTLINFF